MKAIVTETCFDGEPWEHTYDLFINGDLLTADLWLLFTKIAKSSILVVRIRKGQDGSNSNVDSSLTGSNDASEASFAVDISAAGPFAEPESMYTHAHATCLETTSHAQIDNEDTKSTQENGKLEYQQQIVIHEPRGMLALELEATKKALSRVPPFLEWKLKLGVFVVYSSLLLMTEKARTLYLLTIIHRRLTSQDYLIRAMQGISQELTHEYLKNSLYAESPLATLEELENLEEGEDEERTKAMRPQLQKPRTSICAPQVHPPRSVTERELKREALRDEKSPTIRRIIQSTKQVLAHFVPFPEHHILLDKVWGALVALAMVCT